MRQATTAAKLFDQIVAETPPELKKQLDMSFAIADKLDATLKERGMNQKEFAHMIGHTQGRSVAMAERDSQLHARHTCQNFGCT